MNRCPTVRHGIAPETVLIRWLGEYGVRQLQRRESSCPSVTEGSRLRDVQRNFKAVAGAARPHNVHLEGYRPGTSADSHSSPRRSQLVSPAYRLSINPASFCFLGRVPYPEVE